MADFWDNYKGITDQAIILCVISVIQYYADIHYYKTPCRIANLSGVLAEALIRKRVNTRADTYQLICKKMERRHGADM